VDEFLTAPEFRALEAAIAKARASPGLHRERTGNAEALAYRYIGEVRWSVNDGLNDANLANGVVPLKRRSILKR